MNDGKLVAYLALCNDAIRLELEEWDDMELPYTTVPAVKVARLAVSVTSDEQKEHLKALIRQNSSITRKQMAESLDVSARTIQRLLICRKYISPEGVGEAIGR